MATHPHDKTRQIIEGLARTLERGELPESDFPDVAELERLAALCEARGLLIEAARVRRWVP